MRTSVILVLASAAIVAGLLLTKEPGQLAAPLAESQQLAGAAVDATRSSNIPPLSAVAPVEIPPKSAAREPQGSDTQPASERELLKAGALDIDRTVRLAATEQGFEKLLRLLASESSIDASRRQLGYQELFMSDPLSLSGEVHVSQLVCGEKLCAAAVAAEDAEKLSAFVSRVYGSKEMPIYALTELNVPAGAGAAGKGNQRHLIFSVDRSIDSAFATAG